MFAYNLFETLYLLLESSQILQHYLGATICCVGATNEKKHEPSDKQKRN